MIVAKLIYTDQTTLHYCILLYNLVHSIILLFNLTRIIIQAILAFYILFAVSFLTLSSTVCQLLKDKKQADRFYLKTYG